MAERDPIDDCVHCGFCLPSCPTYVSFSEEMDSPRGRIDLMRAVRTRALPLDATVVRHFDLCLGCMACVTACPSGVRYDVLIEETRADVEKHYRRSFFDRLHRAFVFALFPYPKRLRALSCLLFLYAKSGLRWLVGKSGLLKLLPRRLAQLDALMPPIGFGVLTSRLPKSVAPRGEQRAEVGLLAGCVQRVFYPQVNQATLRVLSSEGFRVTIPREQGCCGALSLHAGREAEARLLTQKLISAFDVDRLSAVVVNAAGCGSHLKDCPRLFADDAAWAGRAKAFASKVRDATEFLSLHEPRATRHPIALKVAYHDACHLAHAQRIRQEPRRLLQSIPGLELLEIPDAEQCCGSAGIYNLIEPSSADQIGRRKVEKVLSLGAELLASANPGCTLQIGKLLRERGATLTMAHPIELLDASLRQRSAPTKR